MKKEREDIDFKRNLKIYFRFVKPYKWLFFLIIFIALLMSIAEVIDKFLFKVLIDEGTNFISGKILPNDFIKTLLIIFLIFISILIFRINGQWFKLHILNRVSSSLIFDVKKKFFNHLIHLDHNFHTTHKKGSLISRLIRGSWAIDSLTDFFIFNIAPTVLQLIVISLSILYFDRVSALIVIIMSVIFISYSLLILNRQKRLSVVANNAEDRERANISDVFTNIDSIKYYGKENRIKSIFAGFTEDTKNKFIRYWDSYRWLEAGQSFIIGIGLVLLLYFPLIKFLNGEITIGTLAFLYSVFFSLTGPLFGFIWGISNYYKSMADVQSLFDYEEFKNEIEDRPNALKLKIKRGRIEFRNISFTYKDKKERAIRNLNLKINPNEKIALVGHSGCGKTTLIKLLYRLYDIDSGKILIDGKNIKDFKQESLRSELSIVPQECILFDDTIYNDILFSRPDAKKEEVMEAIKFSQLDRFIKSLPKKEKTIVGERGVKLSGGEKQRVSIARALLANKKVLVLDEAPSSLDSETEHEIQRDLENLMRDRTSIIIAHRLSTIMKADRIVVMERGKIVQIGKHFDLIKKEGIYKRLWNLQKGGYLRE